MQTPHFVIVISEDENHMVKSHQKIHHVFLRLISPQKAAETEDQQTESQVVANPEQYVKHPLQNR